MGKGARVSIECAKIESLTNVSLSERKGQTDRAARAEAKLVWTMPSREPMEQREERLSLLRLSRVATEEDEVKEEDEVSCLDFAER